MTRSPTTRSPTTRRAGTSAPRRRLTAEQARARILAAAEKRLSEVGPEGLRLTDLAAELGVSHPAILHHFGSREELVAAVVASAMSQLNQRLTAVRNARDARSREAILDMVAEFYGAQGNARLIAWLVLSGRAANPRARPHEQRPLAQLIELWHVQRTEDYPERAIEYADTRFRSQLTALALLGDAIFGDLVRHASGERLGAEPAREFRRRLAQLLADEPQ